MTARSELPLRSHPSLALRACMGGGHPSLAARVGRVHLIAGNRLNRSRHRTLTSIDVVIFSKSVNLIAL